MGTASNQEPEEGMAGETLDVVHVFTRDHAEIKELFWKIDRASDATGSATATRRSTT